MGFFSRVVDRPDCAARLRYTTVSSLCRMLEVSRSGYYEWRGRSPSTPPDAAQQVEATVQQYFAQGRGTYGTRRLKHLLA
jgi:putative transposase